ncbi:MAG: YdcF family protein [Chitinophagales bacterium]
MWKFLKISTSLLLISIFLVALFAYYNFALLPKKHYKAAIETPKVYDAIIVPGVPLEDKDWSEIMQMRVFWSYHLYQKGIAKNIIYSGSAVYTPFYESKVMALYAKELGIPEANIFEDSLAEHSTENLYYSWKLAQKLGFEKVALTSDPFQSMMLTTFAKREALPVDFLPFIFDMLNKEIKLYTPKIDIEKARKQNFEALPEREDFFERFKGTLGKKLIEEPY